MSKKLTANHRWIADDSLVAARKILSNYKLGAKKRNIEFNLTDQQVKDLITCNCYYCGIEPSSTLNYHYERESFLYNGIDRIDNSKGYTLENCVPCCHTCNYAKRTLSVDQFLKWVKRIYITQYHKVTDMTPGQLIDLLFTTDYKCWWAQEDIYKYKDIDPQKSAEAAYKAQELNAKRTKLIRTIDKVLDFSEDTNTEKTYSEGNSNEKDNYTYFEKK